MSAFWFDAMNATLLAINVAFFVRTGSSWSASACTLIIVLTLGGWVRRLEKRT